MSEQKRDAPELLADMMDRIERICLDHSVAPEMADAIAIAAGAELAASWGGQLIYFPKNIRTRIRKRDLEIYERFTGDNHAELAQMFDLSVTWVYAIVKRTGAELRRERNVDLFDKGF